MGPKQKPTIVAQAGKIHNRSSQLDGTQYTLKQKELFLKQSMKNAEIKKHTCVVFCPENSWFSPRSSVGPRNMYIMTWYKSAFEPVIHFIMINTER